MRCFESVGDGQVFALSDQTWLELSSEMQGDFQIDKSLYLSVDFLFKDTGEDESVRVILSNKDWSYDTPGLEITAFNEKTAWQPEGFIFLQFNIGVGIREIATRFFDLPMDEWHTATVSLDIEYGLVTFSVNGRGVTKSLTESEGGEQVDPSSFIASLPSTPFRVGAHQSSSLGGEPEWQHEYDVEIGNLTTSNLAKTLVDNLIFQSPIAAGNIDVVKTTLSSLADHLAGEATLSSSELNDALVTLRANLNGTDLNDFASEAERFVSLHGEKYGALYKIQYRNNVDNVVYDDLADIPKAYVELGVWMLSSGLTTDNASGAAGIVYAEYTEFSGSLSATAERITEQTATIRAQYIRDPGYVMGGMKQSPDSELAAYLYRPTGFYAPAGEVVRVKVEPTLVNSGLHIRVGAHADNHMQLSSTSRFPLLSVDYRIESESFEVVNPLGRNIYVLVPQDIDLGWTDVTFSGAVRAPYFSTREGHQTAASEWSSIRQQQGLFTDFESDKFMITVPTAQLQSFDQPQQLLEHWDEIMDMMQVLHGRPLERSRAEAYFLDASQLVIGSFPGGYYTPFAALNLDSWEEDEGLLVMLHELGHQHYGRFILDGEQESYVNALDAAVLSEIFGLDLDEALGYSGYQKFTRTDAAIDWVVTHNFRNGNPIGYDPTTDFEPIETSYQARGHANYSDIADIFDGWDALGDTYRVFYEQDLASGNPPNIQLGLTHDEF
ncbi:MAG: M60 family metallopeptidase [Thalassotalea sp.]|nr:M60 family metallopeptidase [Thalassotalea sp.]